MPRRGGRRPRDISVERGGAPRGRASIHQPAARHRSEGARGAPLRGNGGLHQGLGPARSPGRAGVLPLVLRDPGDPPVARLERRPAPRPRHALPDGPPLARAGRHQRHGPRLHRPRTAAAAGGDRARLRRAAPRRDLRGDVPRRAGPHLPPLGRRHRPRRRDDRALAAADRRPRRTPPPRPSARWRHCSARSAPPSPRSSSASSSTPRRPRRSSSTSR